MKILFFIFVLIVALVIFGSILQTQRFKKEVKLLFTQSSYISDKHFSFDQLLGLPEPVQNYFKHVLKEGHPYISYARLKHEGKFKTGINKDWSTIQGEQYFTTQKPGFIWKGTISGATAYDMYLSDKGRLRVFLLNSIKVVDGRGESFDQGELLRWLGESFWFPTNLLPNPKLQWSPINYSSAKLSFKYNGITVDCKVNFNKNNEVESIETKRFMGEGKLENWLGEFSNYKLINDVLVPTKIKASWLLKAGKFNYVDFQLKTLEYNQPHIF